MQIDSTKRFYARPVKDACSGMSRARLGLKSSVLIVLAALFLLSACSSEPDDDDGVIGTGVVLRGTASENKQFASNTLDVRAQSGERSNGQIGSDGQYSIASVTGAGPWLLRSNLGNNEYRFGIAHGATVAHVHSYTDATLRNWFLREQGVSDLNIVFEDSTSTVRFPTEQEFTSDALQLFDFVALAIDSYQLTPSQLLNESFRADDTGIDSFLDNNPLVLDNQSITILLTDPVSLTQSRSTASIQLGQQLDQADEQAPSVPVDVRALASASDQIVVLWEPATDNTAVVGYQIYRNSVLIDTTAYPVYTDNGLQSGISYDYQVTAIDRAGNRSDLSASASATPQSSTDNTAPPVPNNVSSQLATSSRVDLVWVQDNIADVVAFTIYRGDNGATPSFLVKVSGAGMTDSTVSGGTDYCYQVSAEDASGNVSERSPQYCVLTTGIAIEPLEVNENTVPPLAGLTLPNTSGIDCSSTIGDYTITQTTTLSQGCYQVEQNIVVDRFGVLLIEAGVILKFAEGTSLLVNEGGAMESVGTSDNPVVMTAAQPEPGFWNGVKYDHSDNRQNKISHTVIEYAGGGGEPGALNINASVFDFTRLAVDNSLIRFSDEYGIVFARQGTRISSFSGNLITQNRRAGVVNLENLSSIADGSEFSDNVDQTIGVPRLSVDIDLVIPDLGLPISINGIDQDSGTLIIEAGVELLFGAESQFRITDQVLFSGTTDKPILLTSEDDIIGQWGGVQVVEGANVAMTNVVIEHGGFGVTDNPLGANLYANDARLSLRNVTLRQSSSYGLRLSGDNTIVDQFERISISENETIASLGLSHLALLSPSPTLIGNTNTIIDIEAGTSDQDVDWHNAGVPYQLDGLYRFSAGDVTINPGVTIVANTDSELLIDGSARLNAVGSLQAPISMSALSPGQGAWSGITIQSNQNNVLQNISVNQAGGLAAGTTSTDQNGAVRVVCTQAFPAQLSLSNTRIVDSASWGLYIDDQGCAVNIGTGVEYFNNVLGASNL